MDSKIAIENLGFSNQIKQIDENLTELVKELPNSFWESLGKIFKSDYLSPFSNSFQMEFVVDTNILFSEVRSIMLNDSSFFLRVYDNPLIKVYAPPEIEKELLSKIKEKFPKQKRTRDLDINVCLQKAKDLLKKVIIKDDIDKKALKKATKKLKDRDKKDIPFLALELSIKGDGILTNDRDIRDLKGVKSWKLGEGGGLICNFKKGSFSFVIVGYSMEPILKTIGGILASIWNNIIRAAEKTITLATKILQGGIEGITRMPPPLIATIGIGVLLGLLFDNVRNSVGDTLRFIKDEIIKLFQTIREFIKNMIDAFMPFFEVLMKTVKSFGEMYAYLVINSMATMSRLKEFEVEDVEAEILN